MVKKTTEPKAAFYEKLLWSLFVFQKKKGQIFRFYRYKVLLYFKLINSLTRCYRVILLLEFQVSDIISAIHTARINLSPFTKDFRVWVALLEITIICLQAVPSGTATHLNLIILSDYYIEITNINNPDTTQLLIELKQKV